MKIPNWPGTAIANHVSLARIVSEDSQRILMFLRCSIKSSKDS